MGYFVCDDDVIIDNKMYYKNVLYNMDIHDSDYHYYYEAVDVDTAEWIGYVSMYELDMYFSTVLHLVGQVDKLFNEIINS